MSNKAFLKMTPKERDDEAKKWESGVSFDETRPMSERSQALWAIAKRGRGRPRKAASERVKRVLISLDPNVFDLVEAFIVSKGLDRSKLFAVSVQAFIAAEKALGK
jgi:hypothetical protein